MSIFKSQGHKHLQGIEKTKHLTYGKSVLTFNPKEVYVPLVDPKNGKPLVLKKGINDLVKEGTIIGYREDNMIPVFATVSGKIVREEMMFHALIGRNVKHFVIENDNQYTQEEPLEILDENSDNDKIIQRMIDAAILGHGGAGFPMFLKYKNAKDIDTILVNAVECEPYLSDDHHSLLINKNYIIRGMEILLKISGAKQGILAYKKGNKDIDEIYNDLSLINPNLQIYKVNNVYPSGWEKHLIKEVLNREYQRLPSEAHVIENNVESVVRLAKACLEGKVITRKVATFSGEGLMNQFNVELPIYTRAIDVINFLGGYKYDDCSVSFGGPMCSRGIMDDKACLLSFTSGVTVLPRLKLNTLPCLRCGTCVDHCPSYLKPVEIRFAYLAKNNEKMAELKADMCIECGLCSYVCPSKIDVSDFTKKAKTMVFIQRKLKGGKK